MTLVGIGQCRDASRHARCISPAHMLLIHNLYIVDDIFEIIIIL
jgi:hypothetical protein